MPVFSNKYRRKRGFTLLEAVLFIAIGGVLIPIILTAVGMTSKKSAEALNIYRNGAIADSILCTNLDLLISLGYADSGLAIATDQPLTIGESGFTGDYTIGYVDENLDPAVVDTGYKKITISVTTPGGKEYQLDTFVTSWH